MDNIRGIFVDYEGLFKIFPQRVIDDRYKYLLIEINEFLESYLNQNNLGSESLRVNEYSLLHAVLDYFSDIARLKSFHGINKTNEYKITAYEMYWIMRRKPIQVLADKNEELVFINERFVLSYIISFLSKDVKIDSLDAESKQRIDGFIDSLYYYLKYRLCNPQELEMIFLGAHAGFSLSKLNNSDLSLKNVNEIIDIANKTNISSE